MSHALKLAMLFALVLFAAPFTASAHPALLGGGLASKAATPIVKAGCYYGECEEHVYIRRHCWRGCDDYDGGYWRRRDCGYGGCYHSRYYSHYRRGSYQRYWRPNWCCGHSGWGDD
jgi:hypothetical protein